MKKPEISAPPQCVTSWRAEGRLPSCDHCEAGHAILRQKRLGNGVLIGASGARGKQSIPNRRLTLEVPRERMVAPACAFSNDPAPQSDATRLLAGLRRVVDSAIRVLEPTGCNLAAL